MDSCGTQRLRKLKDPEVMGVTDIRLCIKACGMLVIAVLAFVLPVACGEKPPEIKNPEIIGTWQGGGQTVALFKDGKITLGTNWGTQQTAGKYEFIDEDTIQVKFKSSLPQDYNFSLSADNLIVTSTDGTLIGEYRRISRQAAPGEG